MVWVFRNVILKMKAAPYLIGMFILGMCSCRKHTEADYDIALTNGIASLDVAKEFNALFPDAHNFISYYTGQYGQPHWNSEIGLYGRYVLSVQFDLKFDSSRHIPSRSSEPEFFLVEVSSLERTPDGRLSISYSENQIRFGSAQWEKLLSAEGDFSAIGYKANLTSPHHGFEEVWK